MLPLIPIVMSLLPDAARFIGGMLAGPTGSAVAEDLAGIVRSVTGTDDPAEAQALLEQNPGAATDLRVRLQEVLAAHTLAMAKEDNERDRIAASNTADARAHALAIVQAGGSTTMRDRVAMATVLIFILSTAGSYWTIINNADPLVVALVNIVMGATISSYRDTINYFLGSSLGSANKDARQATRQP